MLKVVLISLLCYCGTSAGICKSNGQLASSKVTVEQNGITFEKIAVNRSVPVHVSFHINTQSTQLSSVSWAHNGQVMKIKEGDSGEVYYKVDQQPGYFVIELHIPSPSARVTGNWTLTAQTSDSVEHKTVCFIGAPPVLHARLGAVRANEGDSLAVECSLESSPPDTEITWKKIHEGPDGAGRLINVDANFTSKDGVKGAVMQWNDATNATGFYLCTATSDLGSDSITVEVRIKGKSAFIYPAVGIALELVVLLVTIIVYERHQAKRRKAEENRGLTRDEK